MNYGLSLEDIKKICLIFRKYPQVNSVILYGSRAKGNYREGSDIDLTLHGNALNLQLLNKISDELDSSSLPYKFDLSIFKQLQNADIIEHIERIGVEFYNKNKPLKNT